MDFERQHAVAKDVTGHVAYSDDPDGIGLYVDPELMKVATHRHPGAAGGDAHGFVVVAVGAARREGIAQPEAVLLAERVGEVGEGCGPFVGGDHQVGVRAVPRHHLRGVDDLARHEVVGDVQQGPDECLVGSAHFVLVGPGPAIGGGKPATARIRLWRRWGR